MRAALADYISGRRTFQTPQVQAAFLAVPRHLFLPGTDLAAAYSPQVVVTKRAGDGAAISSASHPNLVAAMLEQLDVAPGHRVLEIGAGTGINAALLAELAGPGRPRHHHRHRRSTSPSGARRGLAAAGYPTRSR